MPGWSSCRTLLFASLALACASTPARAQDERALEPRRTLSSLQDSARLRLTAPGVYIEEGRFLGFEHDSVHVADADAVLWVGAEEIESLSVRGSKWLTVGVQSAAVGVVGGLLAGFFMGTKECGSQSRCDGHALSVSLRWGLFFGGVGAVAGGAAGSRIPSWREVFP